MVRLSQMHGTEKEREEGREKERKGENLRALPRTTEVSNLYDINSCLAPLHVVYLRDLRFRMLI